MLIGATLIYCCVLTVHLNSAPADAANSCQDTYFNCSCGSSRFQIQKLIKQCKYTKKGIDICLPCNKLEVSPYCSKYSMCLECDVTNNDLRCLSCPAGKYGDWCRGDCNCQNGGTCLRDGSCACPAGFSGVFCNVDISTHAICLGNQAIKNDTKPGTFSAKSSVSITCPPDHTLQGDVNVECTEKGTWTSLAICKPDACVKPPAPKNGLVTLEDSSGVASSKTILRTTAVFSCEPFYQLEGSRTLTCLDNGSWSGFPPYCQKIIACNIEGENLLNKGFAKISYNPVPRTTLTLPENWYQMGSVIVYDCRSTHYRIRPVEAKERICNDDGHWTGTKPTCEQVCGQSAASVIPTVANGVPTKDGEWPWQVLLTRVNRNGEWRLHCAATILNSYWLLTAAHCVTDNGTKELFNSEELRASVGIRDVENYSQWTQTHQIRTITFHPLYNPQSLDADAALLMVDTEIEFTPGVQPVCLPDPRAEFSRVFLQPKHEGIITGWGLTETGKTSNVLQKALMPVEANNICEEEFRASNILVKFTQRMYCAGSIGSAVGACEGDSGGPMVFEDRSSTGRRWIQGGIISFAGPRPCHESRNYNVFTRVDLILDWIYRHL